MTEIALYNTLRKIPDVSDAEAKEAVGDIASSREVVTKADLKAEIVKVEKTIAEARDEANKADVCGRRCNNCGGRVDDKVLITRQDHHFLDCQLFCGISYSIVNHFIAGIQSHIGIVQEK